jgi:O-antigen ligase
LSIDPSAPVAAQAAVAPSRRPDLRMWALYLAAASLPWSKAGISISTGLLGLTSLLYWRPAGTFATLLGKSTALLLIPLLISALHSTDMGQGFDVLFAFWPLAFVFLGAAAVRDCARPQVFLWVSLISSTLATWPTLLHLWKLEMVPSYPRLMPGLPTNVWLYTLAMCTGAIICLVLIRFRAKFSARLSLIAVFCLHVIAIFGTRRRMILIILGGILAAMAPIFVPRHRWRISLLIVLLGVFATLILTNKRFQELTSIETMLEAEQTRTTLWRIGWQTFLREPMLGTGIGDFRDELHALADNDVDGVYANVNLRHSHCHNNFLQMMATSGLLGLAGLVQWVVVLFLVLKRGFKRHREIVALGLAAWALMFVGGLADAPLFSSSRLTAFTLIFGYAWGTLLRPPQSDCTAQN